MKEIIEWIIENKALALFLCISVSISIPVSIHIGKNVKQNITNNYYHGSKRSGKNYRSDRKPQVPATTTNYSAVKLSKIQLYSTGRKGKVFTTTFYKMINHNFGIEITLLNNSPVPQKVKVGWCIYKDEEKVVKGTYFKQVKAYSSLTWDIYVKKGTFDKMKCGNYKSLFWVNDQNVQRVYFKILNK